MRLIALAAIAAAIGVPTSSAANQDHTIVVGNAPTVAQWSNTIGSKLERNLSRMPATPEGMVSVRFRCSEEGRPTAIKMWQTSDSARLDDVARRTVANLKSMHPLPQGIGEDQVYEATIIVAATQYDLDRQIKQLQIALATRGPTANVLAFVVASAAQRF